MFHEQADDPLNNAKFSLVIVLVNSWIVLLPGLKEFN